MEKAIGGYFELELPNRGEYHKNALRLNSGKNCLEYILRCRKYRKVYIPYYTCDVILKPFQKLNIDYQFYHINLNFEISDDIRLEEFEALLYTNYFGLKQRYIQILVQRYGLQLIVDNTQAFYANPIDGIDTFYSCRKFFGVSDGAYLYTDKRIDSDELEQGRSFERMSHLLKRIDLSAEDGFEDFHKNDEALGNQPIRKMSRLTEHIMKSIDYAFVAKQRIENFYTLHKTLSASNRFQIMLDYDAVPMVYPYFHDKDGLREELIQNRIFVARYWPNVIKWVDCSSVEYRLVISLLLLPIDQRYNAKDMQRIVETIL